MILILNFKIKCCSTRTKFCPWCSNFVQFLDCSFMVAEDLDEIMKLNLFRLNSPFFFTGEVFLKYVSFIGQVSLTLWFFEDSVIISALQIYFQGCLISDSLNASLTKTISLIYTKTSFKNN